MNVCGIVLGRSQRARPHREDTHWSGMITVGFAFFERGFDADELSLELEKSLVVRMHTHACS